MLNHIKQMIILLEFYVRIVFIHNLCLNTSKE